MTIELEATRYHRSSGVLFRYVHDVVLLLNPNDRQVVVLGGAGPDLWDLLAEPITVDDAVHRLAVTYAVDAETISSDVRDVFDHLAQSDVLVRADP